MIRYRVLLIRITGNFTLMTQTPTYFRVIHGWNMQWIGWLTGFPHLLRMIFALLFSKWADSALRRNKMSRRNVRKLASALCTIFSGLCLFAMAFSGCNAWIAVFSVTIAIMISGAVSTGPFANVIDISPNYSGYKIKEKNFHLCYSHNLFSNQLFS